MNSSDEDQLDPAVVADLFAEHGDELKRLLVGVLKDPQLANDVMQTAISKLVERGHTTREESRKAWLFRVAVNEAYAVRRRQATGDGVLRRLAWQCEVAYPSSDELTLRQEAIERVRAALDELPDGQREVVRMRIYDNRTFASIADDLNIPLGTALSRMRTALSKLRARLQDEE